MCEFICLEVSLLVGRCSLDKAQVVQTNDPTIRTYFASFRTSDDSAWSTDADNNAGSRES